MSTPGRSRITYRPLPAIAVSALLVAALAGITNALVATVAIALGLDASASHGLEPFAYVPLTIIAAVGGTLGWHFVNSSAARPGRVFRWLVPLVLVLSFLPDLFVALDTGWPNAVALMVMHTLTITIAVLIYRWRMPIRTG